MQDEQLLEGIQFLKKMFKGARFGKIDADSLFEGIERLINVKPAENKADRSET